MMKCFNYTIYVLLKGLCLPLTLCQLGSHDVFTRGQSCYVNIEMINNRLVIIISLPIGNT